VRTQFSAPLLYRAAVTSLFAHSSCGARFSNEEQGGSSLLVGSFDIVERE